MPLGTFLNGRTPVQLRGLAWLSLSDTGHIVGGSITDDGGGGGTTVYTTAGTYACKVEPLGSGESLVADRLSDRSTHIITVPAGAPVTTNKQFAVDGRGTYEITAVRDRTAEWNTRFEAVKT